jgi:hypothetical protein
MLRELANLLFPAAHAPRELAVRLALSRPAADRAGADDESVRSQGGGLGVLSPRIAKNPTSATSSVPSSRAADATTLAFTVPPTLTAGVFGLAGAVAVPSRAAESLRGGVQ